MRRKTIIKTLIITVVILELMFISAIFGYKYNEQKRTKIVHVSFDLENKMSNLDWKYEFLDKEISDFIVSISSELKIDPDLVVAILMKENPDFDCSAIHQNSNGTLDLGLGQLNSAYIWSTFQNRYWDFDFELDPFNWKHNLFIVMHHIEYLETRLKNQDLVIMAYNCGENAVMKQIPASTRTYLSAVKNNLILLKKGGE